VTSYERSLRLIDVNGQNLAEILMPEDMGTGSVILMPTFGMYVHAQQDQSRPHVRTGPARMPARYFLEYLSAIAAAAPDDHRLGLTLGGLGADGQYHEFDLARTMQADDLAAVTGISLEGVRSFLSSHLTFPAEVTE